MGLDKIGEFGLIAEIKRKFDAMIPSDTEGIGDDCAVIPKDETYSYVVTTDMLVEGKHFLMTKISPFELGYKSLAVNLSDVASMGAVPRFSFLSFALPPTIDEKWCFDFLDGYHALSKEYNVPLLGGDTTSATPGSVTISVTVIGEVETKNIKRRSAAQVGDIIAVTSDLGDSAAGLKLILNGEEPSEQFKGRHNTPRPHIQEGEWLGRQEAVHAMMDLSDGVASDITHICRLSTKGADLWVHAIPHSKELSDLCEQKGWNISDLSLSGGEDYSLLLTVKKEKFETIKTNLKKECDTNLYAIGVITEGEIRYLDKKNHPVVQKTGFRHF